MLNSHALGSLLWLLQGLHWAGRGRQERGGHEPEGAEGGAAGLQVCWLATDCDDTAECCCRARSAPAVAACFRPEVVDICCVSLIHCAGLAPSTAWWPPALARRGWTSHRQAWRMAAQETTPCCSSPPAPLAHPWLLGGSVPVMPTPFSGTNKCRLTSLCATTPPPPPRAPSSAWGARGGTRREGPRDEQAALLLGMMCHGSWLALESRHSECFSQSAWGACPPTLAAVPCLPTRAAGGASGVHPCCWTGGGGL